jgi:hypothetical protein
MIYSSVVSVLQVAKHRVIEDGSNEEASKEAAHDESDAHEVVPKLCDQSVWVRQYRRFVAHQPIVENVCVVPKVPVVSDSEDDGVDWSATH